MARRKVIDIFNLILDECGMERVTSLTSLTDLTLYAWNEFQQTIRDIYNDGPWEFSEIRATITMSSAASRYAIASNIREWNPKTFRNLKTDKRMTYLTRERFYASYPDWHEDATGDPDTLYAYRRRFYLHPPANAKNSGSFVEFDGWVKATTFATNNATASQATLGRFPEDLELALLVKWASYRIMAKRGSEEAPRLFNDVFGFTKPGGEKIDGALDRARRMYQNEELDVTVEYNF